jgi:four helix bundle protein
MDGEVAFAKSGAELPIFVKWMDFLKWLFLTTEKFPKKVKFTLSDRIIQLSLAVTEELIEAKYTRNKSFALKNASISLEKIRILMRICYESRILSHQGYEHCMYSLHEVGKMLGGWINYQESKANETTP